MPILTMAYNILLFFFGIFFNVLPSGTQDTIAGVVTGPLCILLGTCGFRG